MAFNEGSSDGTLNGTTEVTLVPAPAASTRRLVKTILVHNADTKNHDLTVKFKNGGNSRILWAGRLDVGDTWTFGEIGDVVVLDSTSKSVVAVLAAAPNVANPDFVASYGDAS